eukprot:1149127-Pelagomonas_calceolata.AAC.4
MFRQARACLQPVSSDTQANGSLPAKLLACDVKASRSLPLKPCPHVTLRQQLQPVDRNHSQSLGLELCASSQKKHEETRIACVSTSNAS